MDDNFNNDVRQIICRTCLKNITGASFLYLDCTPAENTQLTIRQKLCSCIPELDLSVVSNAVICNKCVATLLSLYKFKKNCLQSEIQINKYIQQVQPTGDINLMEVVWFHQPDHNNFDIEIKIEDLEITEGFKNEDLICDTSAFHEASECTEPKYLLELEKVDIENVIFNTFDDCIINYNLSAAEENSDTHSSNIAQNGLPDVIEAQDHYSKNLNKTNACYQCYRCGHKAESKLKLILHVKCHTRRKVYYREIISKRLSRYHKNLFCYRCSLCNYLSKYKCLFDFHNRMHFTKKEYWHIFKHTDVRSNIKINKINMKANKRKCVENCNKYDKPSFKYLNKSKKFEQHFSHCNSLQPNMKSDIVEKPYKCSICTYQCNWKGNLKQHMRIHTGEKPFSCSICQYQCRQKGMLKQHMLHHTGEKPFSCPVCEYQFGQKSTLKRHMLIHTGEKPFACSICEYQCRDKSMLKQHMLHHTGEKPFSCSICEYQFSQKSNLKQHMRIHTGEKPFLCKVCQYQCNRKGDLKQHIRIHTGEKPFSCSVCQYQFSRKSHLRQHIPIHTGEKPFSCSVCQYQCNRKSQLQKHMRIHTG